MNIILPKYTVRPSRRARNLRLSVTRSQEVIVTVPNRFVSEVMIRHFVDKHREWIHRQVKRMEKYTDMITLPNTRADYLEKKNKVIELLKGRVEFFAGLYGFKYGRISVRNQSSIWGSCSRRGNLQFNYKIYYLSQKLRDYIVVHEICHLREHNHGVRFWALVSKVFPNHKELRKQLRKYLLSEG